MTVVSSVRLLPSFTSPSTPPRCFPSSRRPLCVTFPFTSLPPLRPLRVIVPRSSAPENGAGAESLEEDGEGGGEDNGPPAEEGQDRSSSVAELKELMAARKEREERGDLLGGVVEEVRQIEWPAFGKVLGTTGVVLAVIAGSSVALLTVNALLAELSDRVFAGRGLQDFFG
ncbi:hypothetical protein DsansV1_C21g0170041 [Dioscorea sansibarensis]